MTECPKGGSDLQAAGLMKVEISSNREQIYDRFGSETTGSAPKCTIKAHNMTNSHCKMNPSTAGHALALKETKWDRAVKSTCDVTKP